MTLPFGKITQHLGRFLLLACVSSSACEARPRARERPTAEMRPNVPMNIVRDPILFDADGKLRVSETSVGALVIPIGFRSVPTPGGARVFEGIVPIEAVHAFYRARLVSSDIVEAGDFLHFARARPTTNQGIATERFEVTIAQNGQGAVRITVAPEPPPPPTVSETEARRRINEALSRQARD